MSDISFKNSNIENPNYLINIPQDNIPRYSPAPISIPKYSLHKSLLERDEFRKSVELEYYNRIETQKRNDTLKRLLAIGGVVGTIILLHLKKII